MSTSHPHNGPATAVAKGPGAFVHRAPPPREPLGSRSTHMAGYTQRNRSMRVTTPLGPDVLLLTGFSGREGLSRLFTFQLELLATNGTDVPFAKLVGQSATVELLMPGLQPRYFNGVISRLSQGRRDQTFTHFQAEIVPAFWLLSHKAQSRIFQHLSVPEILKKLLAPLNVQMRLTGNFYPREYCVQYRESDFAFASRLMEEEGIFYYFEHTSSSHVLVLGNHVAAHSEVADYPDVTFDENRGGLKEEMRVYQWRKTQELRSGKYTLRDYNFELPYQHLEASRTLLDKAQMGATTVELLSPVNRKLEIYDYPGDYASHFDGIARGGDEQPADLTHIFEENQRYAQVRMEEMAAQSVLTEGVSDCRQFTGGQRFRLRKHFDGDGEYVLTTVEHAANLGANFRSGGSDQNLEYRNRFTALPVAVPYRPARLTPRPLIHGTQPAVVVGPPGEEIFCDKYGRVKLQFLWDREGKWDADSSCWVRVANPTADNSARMVHVPRIKSEVIVAFEEGDPDKPIIVGTVFNAQHMPPWKLPDYRDWHGFHISSYPGDTKKSYQRIDSSSGNEKWEENAPWDRFLHQGNNNSQVCDNNDSTQVGNNYVLNVGNNRDEAVGYPPGDFGLDGNPDEGGDGSMTLRVKQNYTFDLDKGDLKSDVHEGSASYHVKKAVTNTFDDTFTETIKGDTTINVTEGQIVVSSPKQITLKVGETVLEMTPDDITLKSGNIRVHAKYELTLLGELGITEKSSGGIAILGGKMIDAKAALIQLNC